jgi:hypothetical protein
VLAAVNALWIFGKFNEVMSLTFFFGKLSEERVISHFYRLWRNFYFLRHKFGKLSLNLFLAECLGLVFKRVHFLVGLGLRSSRFFYFWLLRVVFFSLFRVFEYFVGLLDFPETVSIFSLVEVGVVFFGKTTVSGLI